jgi:hypothetical protein
VSKDEGSMSLPGAAGVLRRRWPLVGLAWLVLLSCDRPSIAPRAQPSPAPATRPSPAPVSLPAAAPPVAPAPLPAAAAVPASGAEGQDDEDLRAEEPDTDPRSDVVKLKLLITPQARGTVHWGRKKLAEFQPGKMVVETERPRNTGPLDLLIRADGFLPHHVRLFTDRDDKLSVHLVRTEQAPTLFGYRRAASR